MSTAPDLEVVDGWLHASPSVALQAVASRSRHTGRQRYRMGARTIADRGPRRLQGFGGIFWRRAHALGGAPCRPSARSAVGDKVRLKHVSERRTMLGQVFGLREQLKIVDRVVQRVFVSVVHDRADGHWPVSSFPNDLSAKLPFVRVRNLHPSAPFSSALVSSSDTDRANRHRALGHQANLVADTRTATTDGGSR